MDKPERTKQKKNLKTGFLTDHLYYSLLLDMYRGIEKGAKENNLVIITFSGSIINKIEDYTRQPNILYEIAGRESVDGIIIASNIISFNMSIRELTDFCHGFPDLPVVSLGLAIEGTPSIALGNRSGMYEIVDHLIKKHNRGKIVFLNGPESNPDARERILTA